MLNGVVGFRFIGKRVAQGSGRLFHVSLYINRDNVYYSKFHLDTPDIVTMLRGASNSLFVSFATLLGKHSIFSNLLI